MIVYVGRGTAQFCLSRQASALVCGRMILDKFDLEFPRRLEPEKATDIKLVHYRYRGRFGRLYLSGSEDQTRAAKDAAVNSFKDFAEKQTF